MDNQEKTPKSKNRMPQALFAMVGTLAVCGLAFQLHNADVLWALILIAITTNQI